MTRLFFILGVIISSPALASPPFLPYLHEGHLAVLTLWPYDLHTDCLPRFHPGEGTNSHLAIEIEGKSLTVRLIQDVERGGWLYSELHQYADGRVSAQFDTEVTLCLPLVRFFPSFKDALSDPGVRSLFGPYFAAAGWSFPSEDDLDDALCPLPLSPARQSDLLALLPLLSSPDYQSRLRFERRLWDFPSSAIRDALRRVSMPCASRLAIRRHLALRRIALDNDQIFLLLGS